VFLRVFGGFWAKTGYFFWTFSGRQNVQNCNPEYWWIAHSANLANAKEISTFGKKWASGFFFFIFDPKKK
jgi:hypothetical protein